MTLRILILLINLIIPAAMIIFGLLVMMRPTAKDAGEIGRMPCYRSKHAVRSIETWNFANYNFGTMYAFYGFYSVFGTGVICALVRNASLKLIAVVTVVMITLQIVICFVPVFIVESQLNGYFNEDGSPKNPEKVFSRRKFGFGRRKDGEDDWDDWDRDEWRDSWQEEWDDWDLWQEKQAERKAAKEKAESEAAGGNLPRDTDTGKKPLAGAEPKEKINRDTGAEPEEQAYHDADSDKRVHLDTDTDKHARDDNCVDENVPHDTVVDEHAHRNTGEK